MQRRLVVPTFHMNHDGGTSVELSDPVLRGGCGYAVQFRRHEHGMGACVGCPYRRVQLVRYGLADSLCDLARAPWPYSCVGSGRNVNQIPENQGGWFPMCG